MATIKTTGTGSGLRVLTKTADGVQRVSCSCCEEAVCCMYPADQLGVGYSEADLPDSITITIDGVGGDTRTATKSGSEYVYGSYGANGAIPNLKLGVVDDAWVFIPNSDNLSAYVQPCLFDTLGGTTEAEFTIEDNFADTYTYTAVFNGATLESGTLTRESLCVWSNSIVQPLMVGIFYNSNTFRFEQLDANEFAAVKSGPSNSPEGEYVVPMGGLYGGGILTVS